jgi:hypothetical protein
MYDPLVPGKYTAVLLVGAFVTSAADPWSCAGPGWIVDDGASPVTTSTLLDSKVHAKLGWGSEPKVVSDILSNKL